MRWHSPDNGQSKLTHSYTLILCGDPPLSHRASCELAQPGSGGSGGASSSANDGECGPTADEEANAAAAAYFECVDGPELKHSDILTMCSTVSRITFDLVT